MALATPAAFRFAAKSFAANALPSQLFRADIDDRTVRRLFRRFVRVVEIENHSYCNRTCWFCPNAQIDRRSAVELMPDAIFDKILSGLQDVRYARMLTWSRYHEPMAHPSFFARATEARRRLPDAYLVAVSNGDYLDRDAVQRLEAARFDQLILDLYLVEGKERDPGELKRVLTQFEARTGLACVAQGSPWEYVCKGSGIAITMGVPQYSFEGGLSSRGGLVDVAQLRSFQRRSVCFHPLHSVVIDYNGKCMLCCQVRSDAPQHAGAIIGDLSQPGYSLFDFYRDLAPARKALVAPGPKTGPCRTCNVNDGGPDRGARRPAVASLLGVPPINALCEWGLGLIPFRGHLRKDR